MSQIWSEMVENSTCLKKFSRLSFALNLYSMGIFYENKVKKIILFLEKFTGCREYCWFWDIERSKLLCNKILTHIYGTLQYKTDILSEYFLKTTWNISSPFPNQYTKSSEIRDSCNLYLCISKYFEKLDIGCI